MNPIRVCVHGLSDTGLDAVPEFSLVSNTRSREELRKAIGLLRPEVLVIDLDAAGAQDAVVECLEIDSGLAVIGVTGHNDATHMVGALRAGCRQLSIKPLDPNDLVVAIRRSLNENAPRAERGKAIAVFGAVGGAGATTVACYLAAGLAEATRSRSLIVDFDFDFGGVARAWNLTPMHTIGDMVSAGTIDGIMLDRVAVSSDEMNGVSIVPRPHTIEEGHAVDEHFITSLIHTAQSHYASVVMDLPRKLDAVVGCAMEACDKLLVVMQLTVPSIDNARRLIEALTRNGMSMDRIELIVNRFRKNVHALTVELVEKQFGRRVIGVVPNDYRSVTQAIDMGQPVADRNPVRSAIQAIAERLVGGGEREAPAAEGWFARLTGKANRGAAAGA